MIDTIDSRDTQFTVDTYQIFTLEHEHEHEINCIHESNSKLTKEQGLPEFDDVKYFIDDYIDFEFDMVEYQRDLSFASIEYIKELDSDNSKIINSIEFNNSQSPKFYNYTTDSYTMTIDYDNSKMQAWIIDNYDYFVKYLDDNSNLDFHLIKRGFLDDEYNDDYINSLYSVQLLAYLDYLYYVSNVENSQFENYYYSMTDSVPGYEYISWSINTDKIDECKHRKIELDDLSKQIALF